MRRWGFAGPVGVDDDEDDDDTDVLRRQNIFFDDIRREMKNQQRSRDEMQAGSVVCRTPKSLEFKKRKDRKIN